MPRKKLTKERIGRLLGAVHREAIAAPFYYAPPFLDRVREELQSRLESQGGRPSVPEWEVVRKTRYSRTTWDYLGRVAQSWSHAGVCVSPAHVAACIVEQVAAAQAARPEGQAGPQR